ncbi:hypothetical protein DV736_g157, partial [Chaetothyriales sp. CBS 134916]
MDPASTIVLITGINGYIASHIGLQLLEAGYSVRGTSRSATSTLVGPRFDKHASRYQHIQVNADITSAGTFDAAVRGVHSIIHTASPVDFSLTSYAAFRGPAVGGLRSILASVQQHAGPQLRSFVLTSSIAAVVDRWKNPVDYAYTERDWNTSGEAVAVASDTKDGGPFAALVAYGASKAAAERALWEWRHAQAPRFTVAAINPGTLRPVWEIYAGEVHELPPPIGIASYIDVRDVAALHVWAAVGEPGKADGQRYIATNGKAPPQAIADILRARFPERKAEIIEGEPGKGYVHGTYWWVDGEARAEANKAYEALGVDRFRGFEDSILDTVEAFEKQWPGLAAATAKKRSS